MFLWTLLSICVCRPVLNDTLLYFVTVKTLCIWRCRIIGRRKACHLVAVHLTCPSNTQTILHHHKLFQIPSGLSRCLPLRPTSCTRINQHCRSIDIQVRATGQCLTTWGCGPACRCSITWWILAKLNMALVSVMFMIRTLESGFPTMTYYHTTLAVLHIVNDLMCAINCLMIMIMAFAALWDLALYKCT